MESKFIINIYMMCATLPIKLIFLINGWMAPHFDIWDGMISSPRIKRWSIKTVEKNKTIHTHIETQKTQLI